MKSENKILTSINISMDSSRCIDTFHFDFNIEKIYISDQKYLELESEAVHKMPIPLSHCVVVQLFRTRKKEIENDKSVFAPN